jgi:hypothetical protein
VERFGKIEDVMGDGNCGFYAALLGLERMKRIEQKTITEFRKDLWEFASANQTQIKTVAIPEGQRNAIGKNYSWEEDMMNPLYRQGNSYEKGCGSQSWIRGEWHFPLIAYKFQITIVVYSTSTTRSIRNNGGILSNTPSFSLQIVLICNW